MPRNGSRKKLRPTPQVLVWADNPPPGIPEDESGARYTVANDDELRLAI
jgi:hypothetical protein